MRLLGRRVAARDASSCTELRMSCSLTQDIARQPQKTAIAEKTSLTHGNQEWRISGKVRKLVSQDYFLKYDFF